MHLGPHADFIITAYAAGALVVFGLIAWVVFDHRHQTRVLDELEARGVTRRSQRSRGEQT